MMVQGTPCANGPKRTVIAASVLRRRDTEPVLRPRRCETRKATRWGGCHVWLMHYRRALDTADWILPAAPAMMDRSRQIIAVVSKANLTAAAVEYASARGCGIA